MMKRFVLPGILILLAPTIGVAQTGDANTPATQTVRAAGMPLQDGALEPGSLTVRVVQGAFTGNLEGVDVQLTMEGQDSRHASTGADGRAVFAHVPIGSRVQASATVNGERMASETFPVPVESGVRLLLVAGEEFVDATTAEEWHALAGQTANPLASPAAAALGAETSSKAPESSGDPGISAVRIFVVAATVLAFGLVGYQQWNRRRRSPPAASGE